MADIDFSGSDDHFMLIFYLKNVYFSQTFKHSTYISVRSFSAIFAYRAAELVTDVVRESSSMRDEIWTESGSWSKSGDISGALAVCEA